MGGIALAAGACSAPATGGTTTTTTTTSASWVAAGCLDGAGADGSLAPDLLYSGIPNHRGNATISAVLGGGGVSISGDGSCAGQPVASITIVRATDAGAATTVCASIGAGTDPATAFAGTAWSLPSDAFFCSETITL
jgi:hypothetical protein